MIDEVLFLRHGRTAYNLARRLQGQIDIPLDIVGRWQADQSAYELAKTYYWVKVAHLAEHNDQLAQPAYGNAHLADVDEINNAPAAARRMLVVSSDLFRAQQTAHAFADLMGLDVELDPRLRERSFGEWEGMTREEIRDPVGDGSHLVANQPAAASAAVSLSSSCRSASISSIPSFFKKRRSLSFACSINAQPAGDAAP